MISPLYLPELSSARVSAADLSGRREPAQRVARQVLRVARAFQMYRLCREGRSMSARLVGDVVEWLRTPAAKDLTGAERIVLITIADRVLDDQSRLMRRFKGDDCELYERLCQVADLTPNGLKKVLSRLAEKGLDVRVVMKYDKHARPVYACRGNAMDFRLPDLPPSVHLPPKDPVDDSSRPPPEGVPHRASLAA